MTDAQILTKVQAALRRGEQENMHLRGAWIATAEEEFYKIPKQRRTGDLLSVERCLMEAGKASQKKDWDKMMSFIESTHNVLDVIIG